MFGNKSLIRKEINNRSLTEIEITTEQVRLRGLTSEVTGERVAMKTPTELAMSDGSPILLLWEIQ